MNYLLLLLAALGWSMPGASAQPTKKPAPKMSTQHLETVTNPLVKSALVAINEQDAATWYALFAPTTTFSDDGRQVDFKHWSDKELFGRSACRILSVDRLEDQGLSVYCVFHSDRYGDFQTFMRFRQQGNQLIGLAVGQTKY